MPVVTLSDNWELLPFTVCYFKLHGIVFSDAGIIQDILSTVNIQHRCYNHRCKASGVEYIYQEQQLTTQTRCFLEHIHPSDCVLNTTQMRDALQLDTIRYHIDPASISFANAILEGVQKEIDAQTGRSGTGLPAGGLSSMVGPDRSGLWQGRG
jgi:hypothetical protein